jgi:hypothetical protein
VSAEYLCRILRLIQQKRSTPCFGIVQQLNRKFEGPDARLLDFAPLITRSFDTTMSVFFPAYDVGLFLSGCAQKRKAY